MLICGWALDESASDPVEIIVEIGGRYVGQFKADRFREDLAAIVRSILTATSCHILPMRSLSCCGSK